MRRSWRDRRAAAAAALVTAIAIVSLLGGPSPAIAASDASRYSLVHGCFALQSAADGKFVRKAGGGYAATAGGAGGAEPFRMQATALGRYLFYGAERDFMALSGSGVEVDAKPSNASDLTVEKTGETFTIRNKFNGEDLAVAGDGTLTDGGSAEFNFVETTGCPRYPEITTNVEGAPSTRSPRYGEAEGLLEGHMHHMAFRFLGGAHCGRPWHRFGVPYALVDCPDHEPNGCAAVLENALYGDPARCHDTTGWPDFTDWPDPKSLTHEQSYYKWLERAYRSGLRVFVNLMVQNRALCEIYPIKGDNPECDDTKTVDIELKEAYRLQDYIDAQEGGPGKGWYRIVKNPFQAREVINEGKLAVVLGMEVSEPFTCRTFNGVPSCDQKTIKQQINHLYKRGVRQMEITNKFDNALTGVAGDNGETGTLVNFGNFYATGRFWDMDTCQGPPEEHDHTPTGVEAHNDDLILANVVQEYMPGGVLPVYPKGPLCNTMGLTELGEFTIRRMMQRGMIFDPDHMSVKGRDAALNLLEAKDYPGVISSHSWSTPGALPRIYRLGGIVTPYAGGSEGFVDKWDEARQAYRGRQFFGMGWGADQNGFGGQGGPRGTDVANPVTYPFESFDGQQTISEQRSGNRVYDINADGVAHYGLYPDWVQDLRELAGDEIIDDLGNGAEAYLQMWERAEGVPGVHCPVWRGRFTHRGLGLKLRIDRSTESTLYRAGQPVRRNRSWQWCTRFDKGTNKRTLGKKRRVAGVFDTGGNLRLILSTLARHPAGGISRGDRRRVLRGRTRSLGKGIYVERGNGGRLFVYRTRGKKVRYVGIASAAITGSDRQIRNYVLRAHLQ